ncbi:methyltransferase domain-containing protein [Leptospira wolffii]|uniref:Methyltransferase domain-containing protein n=1 Tax=Leptospira wolffii TaxID=409998 RepID=A0ABV5BR34_9LEPT|nr:class I SAM-dependent methyltransferase [Leptospira wolffii]EPG66567.1 methyltransferase domain protein [Leptospira wolffii serovar Khorat str. Khorat-H2]TGL54690.1 class I SAM-dependent methyltransferase [Leptospira wolffii]
MKVRDSGMPDAKYWDSLFDLPLVLEKMDLLNVRGRIVEFGSGYGTFTFPLAKENKSEILAYEIEESLVFDLERDANRLGLDNIHPIKKDIVEEGTGLGGDFVDYVMIFNLLHHEDPVSILREAFRILKPGGRSGLMHWNYDPNTPRGPKMEIRPRPGNIYLWAREAGFRIESEKPIDLPPFHYGFVVKKPI